jgi:hypothetical protein
MKLWNLEKERWECRSMEEKQMMRVVELHLKMVPEKERMTVEPKPDPELETEKGKEMMKTMVKESWVGEQHSAT